ncbi:ABC transporter substrate-binding protein [Frigidibacter sp. ROC022]|uniref:ABC transporter substrate-binding protein n=1 Tax=Frigidibacter sp. ROC022 TaxID=2971796 RepID=UPI00215A1C47|nr:ABC transporter substrate-binding protein [Frigidibacter sp. ROC022]MCR8725420.1 ABC transporter substrate-binding protein [Frigidibacter sp. ROC022]
MRPSSTTLGLIAGLMLASPVLAAELTTNLPADPAMLDPITYSELVAGDVLTQIYESFTAIDAEGNVIPALAESWEPLADNMGFRFHLRKGVKFHSGREFTAKDVKATLEQLLIPENKGGLNAGYAELVAGADKVKDGSTTELSGVRIIDDYTVEISFDAPDVLFPLYPLYIFDSEVAAEAGPDWLTTVSAGTGPFKLDEWSRGQEVHLVAHEDYWRGAPELDGVHFMIVPEMSTALSMYETGELDVLRADSSLNRQIFSDAGLKDQIMTSPTAQVRYVAMNPDHYAPFQDVKVREAVCISYNQDEMIEGLYEGAGEAHYGAITPGVAGYSPDVAEIKYDPERAKALLAEAGYPEGAGLPPLKLNDTANNKTEDLYMVSKWQAVGFPVELEVLERGAMLKGMNSQQIAFFPWGWSADYPDGLNFLLDLWYSKSPYNKGYSNPDYDALIEQAKQTADSEARYEIYHAAEKLLLDDWGMCPKPLRLQVLLVKPGVEGIRLTPFRMLPFEGVTKAE